MIIHHPHHNSFGADDLMVRGRSNNVSKLAPGHEFNHEAPPDCMGICAGLCQWDGHCPFLGCPADASHFGPSPGSPKTPILH